MQTGRPMINPEARYTTQGVTVLPWMGGGHVWPPWSYSPDTQLVYIPSDIGRGNNYASADEFEVNPGGINMGVNFGGRGGGAADDDGLPFPEIVDPPEIGPRRRETTNILSAWDPVTQTERWRAENGSGGFNQGGTLATAGNLVFSVVTGSTLRVFAADTGESLLDLPLGLNMAGPPMTFMLDGVQYVVVAGGPPGGGGRGGGGRGGADGAGAPPPPARLMALAIDGSTPLPGVQVEEDDDQGPE
jgi:hypothetical protein